MGIWRLGRGSPPRLVGTCGTSLLDPQGAQILAFRPLYFGDKGHDFGFFAVQDRPRCGIVRMDMRLYVGTTMALC